MRIPGREPLVPVLLLGAALLVIVFAILREQLEEIPHVPYELAEYVGVTPEDLGTTTAFDDPAALLVERVARRAGRVRFLLAGDGGEALDAGERALSRRMRALCREEPCDFVLFTGDNVYPDGIDTFAAAAARALPGVDLQGRFLAGLAAPAARDVAARVRGLAGAAARACGGVGHGSGAPAAAASALQQAADSARARHFRPKFESTFGWLAEEGIPAYLVLGNHDWRSPLGAECEIGRSLAGGTAWRLPFYFYRLRVRDPADGRPLADFLALYSAPPHGAPRGENYVRIGPRQRAWLRQALAASDAPWRLAVSHHPVWSAGGHTFLEYLSFHRDVVGLAAETGAAPDLLLAGHNHWLESVKVSVPGRAGRALQVVSGSLSKVAYGRMFLRGYPFVDALALQPLWRLEMAEQLGTSPTAFLRRDRSVLTRGFALVELDGDGARVRFFGTGGEIFSESLSREERIERSILASGSRGRSAADAQRNGARTRRDAPGAGEHTSGRATTRRWE